MINTTHFDNFPQLESERLLFRAFSKKDARGILKIRGNKEVMTYMDSPTHLTLQDAENFIIGNQETYAERKGIFWAIVEKSSGEMIGDFAYWRIDSKHGRTEIGYTLQPLFWGKGYMKETMITLLHFGFTALNIHSIEANINPKNIASRKALLKMGFRKEAYFRENFFFDGQFLDSEIYSLLEKWFISG